MSKKENAKKKSLIRFWILIICSGVVGGIIGFISMMFSNQVGASLGSMRDMVIWCSPYMMIVVNIILLAAVFLLMKQSNQLLAGWDQEAEETYEIMERKSGIALGITSVDMIITMVCFGISLSGFGTDKGVLHNNRMNLVFCGVFIALILIITFVQRQLVEFAKKINPEMRGDALDTNFQKTWLESCDELQRQQIYKAAYKAYASSNILFPVLLVFLMIGQLYFAVGIMPIIAVGIVWLVQTVIYVSASLKIEGSNKEA